MLALLANACISANCQNVEVACLPLLSLSECYFCVKMQVTCLYILSLSECYVCVKWRLRAYAFMKYFGQT